MGEAGSQELTAAACPHFCGSGSREKEMPVFNSLLFIFAFLFSHGLSPMGWCCPHSRWPFPSQVVLYGNVLTDTLKGTHISSSHLFALQAGAGNLEIILGRKPIMLFINCRALNLSLMTGRQVSHLQTRVRCHPYVGSL